ncbi:MAG: 2-amino-4-hydroxy-6-hydroxymethyldihydropteridine diphosphokinase [bacterium]
MKGADERSPMEHMAFLSLGSNVGASAENVRAAVVELRSAEGLRVVRVSSLYLTSPVGRAGQADFVNAAVKAATVLTPEALLATCKGVERRMGRGEGGERWGERVMDVDIILYDGLVVNTEKLTIPHPMFRERLFVLLPLLEIEPGARTPDGTPVEKILRSGLKKSIFFNQKVARIE